MTLLHTADTLKSCCAALYEEPVVRALLGDVFHPGGLRTTDQLGRMLGLSDDDRVLDVACGPARSAAHLAEQFGCRVAGIDYSLRLLAEARARREDLWYVGGDAEGLPFAGASFDAVVIECLLCLCPDKSAAVREMARVLRPGGRLGVADLALERPLPSGMSEVVAWAGCLAGACATDGYRDLIRAAEFVDVTVEDASWALAELVEDLGRKLFLLNVAEHLGKISSLPMSIDMVNAYLQAARQWIANGQARYLLLTARRSAGHIRAIA
ncbi:MAG: methyltransferase domain-containing protein [Armatimonadetes bacterium]|nr:methyltransferase domain-containing protein [Armatimonadota bacterium]